LTPRPREGSLRVAAVVIHAGRREHERIWLDAELALWRAQPAAAQQHDRDDDDDDDRRHRDRQRELRGSRPISADGPATMEGTQTPRIRIILIVEATRGEASGDNRRASGAPFGCSGRPTTSNATCGSVVGDQ
jgi:hypothetical protein